MSTAFTSTRLSPTNERSSHEINEFCYVLSLARNRQKSDLYTKKEEIKKRNLNGFPSLAKVTRHLESFKGSLQIFSDEALKFFHENYSPRDAADHTNQVFAEALSEPTIQEFNFSQSSFNEEWGPESNKAVVFQHLKSAKSGKAAADLLLPCLFFSPQPCRLVKSRSYGKPLMLCLYP